MQEAVPIGTGAMAAILGLDDDAVRAACAEAAQGEVVEAVNFNAPSQVVIAGHKAAVERAAAAGQGPRRQTRGHAAGERAVSFFAAEAGGASASSECMLASVTFQAPQIPVINNVDVAMRAAIRHRSRTRWRARPAIPCAGSKSSRHWRRRASPMSPNAGRARCWPGLTKRIDDGAAGIGASPTRHRCEQSLQALKMSGMMLKDRWHWLPARHAASAAPSRWNSAALGATVAGTATTAAGADGDHQRPGRRRHQGRGLCAERQRRGAGRRVTGCGAEAVRRHHDAGQQRRHHARQPADAHEGRGVGRHHVDQSQVGVPAVQGWCCAA